MARDERERFLGRPAVPADTDDLDVVGGRLEANLSRSLLDPASRTAAFELDHTMAPAADHMVVVRLAAQAIAGLSRDVRQRIQNPALRKRSKCAVHRREPDRFARRS